MGEDNSRKLRNKIFISILLITGFYFVVNDYYNWIDECAFAYGIIILFGIVSLFFGSWWWFICGKATDVFKWLMTLIFGIVVAISMNLYARIHFLLGDKNLYDEILSSVTWKYRMVIEAIALIYIVSLMTARIFHNKKECNGGK